MKAAIVDRARRWLRAAGADAKADDVVEIGPLFALDAAELTAKLTPGFRITGPTRL